MSSINQLTALIEEDFHILADLEIRFENKKISQATYIREKNDITLRIDKRQNKLKTFYKVDIMLIEIYQGDKLFGSIYFTGISKQDCLQLTTAIINKELRNLFEYTINIKTIKTGEILKH